MPSYKRPGVYFEEKISQAQVIGGANLSAAAFLAANHRGPTTPTLITSWSQYLSMFGGFSSNPANYLPFAVFQFFANGGREAYICRVTGSGAAAATKTLNDQAGTPLPTLKIDATSPGIWGGGAGAVAGIDTLYLDVTDSGLERFNLTVRLGGTGDQYVVERWGDLSMDPADARYASAVINSTSAGSTYVTVTDLVSGTAVFANRPAVQAGTAMAGGADGSAVADADLVTALTRFDVVDAPLNLNLPGNSVGATISSVLAYAAARGDVFVVIDSGQADDPATAIATAASITASSFGAVYYPWINVVDPASNTPGAMRSVPPGGSVLGLYATTDVLRGVFKTPAGINTRVGGAIGVVRKLTGTDLDSLNAAQVNAIKQIPGAGVVVYGGRTLKLGTSDKYVAVRRSLIYIRSSLIAGTRFAVFEPNDSTLWGSLSALINRFLLQFWQAGGLRGGSPAEAFYVKCDSDNNTPQSIAAGEVHIEIGVALQYPAEFVVIKLSQREVGATVTVAA